MIVADSVLGTVEEFEGSVEWVHLDDDERKRSRVRTTTDAGTEVGLALGDTAVSEGDVVYADERVIAVAFEETEALVVDLSGVDGTGDELAALVELGHVVGNRHRDLAVRDGEVLLPVEREDDRVEAAVRPHLPGGATTRRETVDPTLFDGSPASAGHTHDETSDEARGHAGHGHRSHAGTGDGGHDHAERDNGGHGHAGHDGRSHGEGDHGRSHGEGDYDHSHDGDGRTDE